MGRIKLDSDLEIKPPVVSNEVLDGSITIGTDSVNVRLDWKHQEYDDQVPPQPVGEPVLVSTEHFAIIGADYTQLATATVSAAHIGQTFFSLIRKAIRNKVKSLKALEGTVE